jgi:hypothetical protein
VKQIRRRLTYANVMSTIGVVLLLGTGAAVAAKQVLPKKSVGAKQLKSNAVTTAKIKKNAVTKAKIKKGAVDGSKIADESIGGAEINAASTPFGRIVFETRGSATIPVPISPDPPALYPLANPAYTQEAGRDDTYLGAVDVTFEPGCTPNRSAAAYIAVDPADPNNLSEYEIIGLGGVQDQGTGTVTRRVEVGPYQGGVRFQPSAPTNHTIYLYVQGQCDTGSGITATFGGVDVIGTK